MFAVVAFVGAVQSALAWALSARCVPDRQLGSFILHRRAKCVASGTDSASCLAAEGRYECAGSYGGDAKQTRSSWHQ